MAVLFAPIAQRIEHRPPEPGAGVRVALGAPYDGLSIPPKPPSGVRVDSPNVYSTSTWFG